MSDQRLHSMIAREALEWFIRNSDGELSGPDRAQFATWLGLSSLHVEHYLRTAAISRDLRVAVASLDVDVDTLIQESDSSREDRVVSLHAERPVRPRQYADRRRYAGAIAAVFAVALISIGGYTVMVNSDGERFGLPKAFSTREGQQLSWLLPDGSRLSLNSGSRVVVRYNSHERLVTLDRGQAFFQVAHDKHRRFRAMAGDGGAIAIGTQFDIRRTAQSTVITVVEGRVAVFTGQPPAVVTTATLPPHVLTVDAGRQARIDQSLHAAPLRLSLTSADVPVAVTWLQHKIAFDQQPLGNLAAEFSHYNGVPIVIESDRLRQIQVSGVFSAYDTDSFLQFVAKLDGVEIQRSADQISVLDKRQ